jgi:ribonuclease Z
MHPNSGGGMSFAHASAQPADGVASMRRRFAEFARPVQEFTQMIETPLTSTPIVGSPAFAYGDIYVPGEEELHEGEIRVTVLGAGDPWPRRDQASGSFGDRSRERGA